MTNPPGERQFDVPIPGVGRAVPENTQVIPVDETTARAVPYAAGPAPAAAPAPAPAETQPVRRDSRASRFGAALFWMTIGFWVFVGIRVAKRYLDHGWSNQMLYDTVAMVREETVVAAGLSVVAALFLLAARGRRLLGVLALLVAAATVTVAIWRYLP